MYITINDFEITQKMEINLIKKWNDLTLGRYIEIDSVLKTEYDDEIEKGIALVSAAYGIDARNIDFNAFKTLSGTLALLNGVMPQNKVKNAYTINGTEYTLDTNYTTFTTAQYMDMMEYQKQNDLIGFLSVVLIPKGCTYNNDYDIEKTKDDLTMLSVADGLGIVNFFQVSSVAFTQRFLRYLRKKTKKLLRKKDKVKAKELNSKMKQLEAMIGEYCRTY